MNIDDYDNFLKQRRILMAKKIKDYYKRFFGFLKIFSKIYQKTCYLVLEQFFIF